MSTGRISGRASSGSDPAVERASRASRVMSIAAWTWETSVSGSAVVARSRPIAVSASCARSARTAFHSVPGSQVRPASTLRLIRSRPGSRECRRTSRVLRLIGHPFAPLGLLAGGEGFALPPNAGLLVVLTLFELRQEPGFLALLLEALEGALEGLVGLDDDLGHAAPPSERGHTLDKQQLYTTRPTLGQRTRRLA